MKTALVTIGGSASVFEAAKKMAGHNIGSLLVESGGKITGIVTDSDLVKKCLAAENVNQKISDIASKHLIGIAPEADLSEAAKLMGQKKVQRLAVQKSGRVVGIISQSDIVRISPSLYDLIAQKQALQART
ncbi:MAG: CBS domain-containing protein [Candidatus Norongarragalinales archaeon]